jgi:hypothetical protein
MSQTGSIQGAKIGSYNNMNDPTYPGPEGKMFTWKRNVALHLAQTRLPKSVYEYIDMGSEIFDLPPSYKTIEATIVATPEKKKDPEARGHYWIDSPGGEAIKRLCFTEDGALLERASVGTVARRAAPCKITAIVRKSLEQHCYVQVMRFVDLKEYNYILTSAAVSQIWRFPCSDAGIARCCVFGSRHLPQDFKKGRQSVEIRIAG